MVSLASTTSVLVTLALVLVGLPAVAQTTQGQPAFGSLKADQVELRSAPGLDHPVALVFRRVGMPVQVLERKPGWNRVRDYEGTTGWVEADLVSRRRTAMAVKASNNPAGQIAVRTARSPSSGTLALLEPGVIVSLVDCEQGVCRVSMSDLSGYVDQVQLWGVADDIQ